MSACFGSLRRDLCCRYLVDKMRKRTKKFNFMSFFMLSNALKTVGGRTEINSSFNCLTSLIQYLAHLILPL